MSTYIKSSAFTQTNKNGKIVNQRGYDAVYDGNVAVIDAVSNGNLFRIELDKDDVFDLLKKFYKSGTNSGSNSGSLKDSLMRDFNIDKTSLLDDLYKYSNYSKSRLASVFSDRDEDDMDSGRSGSSSVLGKGERKTAKRQKKGKGDKKNESRKRGNRGKGRKGNRSRERGNRGK